MQFRVADVAATVGGTLLAGDGAAALTGVATLEEAGPADLSFFGVPKYRPQFEKTRAGAVLVPRDVDSGPVGVALIQVENPSMALASLVHLASEAMRNFKPGVHAAAHVADEAQVDPGACVHAGAVVEAGAIIGAGTEIRSGAVVCRGARIGANCVLHPNTVVREGCVLGDRVILQPGAVIGSDGYGYVFDGTSHRKIPQIGIVVIEDDVEIGANTCIDRARFGKTLIGAGSKLDNLVQVGHNVEIGKHCLLIALSGVAGSAKLGDFVTLGAQTGISGHIEIASGVQLAGQSGVHKSITAPGAYLGAPAKPAKEELRIWRGLAKLHETTQEVKALRKEIEELKARL